MDLLTGPGIWKLKKKGIPSNDIMSQFFFLIGDISDCIYKKGLSIP